MQGAASWLTPTSQVLNVFSIQQLSLVGALQVATSPNGIHQSLAVSRLYPPILLNHSLNIDELHPQLLFRVYYYNLM